MKKLTSLLPLLVLLAATFPVSAQVGSGSHQPYQDDASSRTISWATAPLSTSASPTLAGQPDPQRLIGVCLMECWRQMDACYLPARHVWSLNDIQRC